MLTTQDITTGAARVAEAKSRAFQAGEQRILTNEKLEYERALAYRENRIEGSNDTTRKAHERVLLAASFEAQRQAERNEREARLALELALLHWEKLKLQLRLCEVLAQDRVGNVHAAALPLHIIGEEF